MKILIIQENGRHEENRKYRECFCLQRAFVKLGHEVDVWGLGHENYNIEPEWKIYNIIVNLENYDLTNWVPIFGNNNAFKFLWVIDPHARGMQPYNQEFKRNKYDVKLNAVYSHLDIESVYFPNAYDDTLFDNLNLEKKYTFGFCGGISEPREKLFKLLKTRFEIKDIHWLLGDKMVEMINSFKIQINLNASDDINYRTFETCGCGTVLLTNHNYCHGTLGFEHGVNFLEYKDTKDLINIMKDFGNDDAKLKEIAAAGYNLVRQRHTYLNRAKEIIELCKRFA